MPGSFAYTKSTNTIVVTNGTEGAPATFNDMYIADQAGTVELLAAWSPDNNTKALTYQLTPADKKGLKIDFVIESKTAEADYIFITGTDIDGNAQTESIDVTSLESGGGGTFTTTKWFATITNIDCSDNSAGGGTVWADGTVQVVQNQWGVIHEIVEDGSYKIDCIVEFGDAATATYFRSSNEEVFWADGIDFYITANAVVTLGDLDGTEAVEGSKWSFAFSGFVNTVPDGTFNLYASTFEVRNSQYWYANGGTISFKNSTFLGNGSSGSGPLFSGITLSIERLNIIDAHLFNSYDAPVVAEDLLLTNVALGFYGQHSSGEIVITDFGTVGTRTTDAQQETAATLVLKDPKTNLGTVRVNNAIGAIIEQYTCNIHIADKDGADLESATIQCQTFGNVVSNDGGSTFYKCLEDHTSGTFATDLAAGKWELTTAAYAALAGCVGGARTGEWVTGIDYVAAASEFSTATDVNGDITEQTIDYKKWIGTSEALLTYGPFTFTFTHASYPNFVMNEIVADHPIVWEFDMGQSTSDIIAIVQGVMEDNDVDHLIGMITEDSGGNEFTTKALINAAGMDADDLHTALDSYSNKGDYKATGFNTVTPDAAGVAAGLHAATDAKVDAVQTQTDKLDNMITEESGANEFTTAALANAPTAGMDADDLHTALDSYSNKGDWKADTTAIAAAVWGYVVEGTYTYKDFMRLIGSVLFGKATGGGTANPKYRDMADSKNRIVGTVDANGNRTAVTKDAT